MKYCGIFLLVLFFSGCSSDSINPEKLRIIQNQKRHGLGVIPNDIDEDNMGDRLPKNLVPVLYNITIRPYVQAPGVDIPEGKNETFLGKVDILANVTQSTSEIVLSCIELSITHVSVYSYTHKEFYNVTFDSTKCWTKNETLTLKMDNEFEQNEELKISIQWAAKIRYSGAGFFKSTPFNKSRVDDVVYATQFERYAARSVFPCFDEPAYKAYFKMYIVKPKLWTALFNSDPKTISDFGEGLDIVEFELSPYMSTYLVAFALGDLVSMEGMAQDGLIIRTWAYRSAQDGLGLALSNAIKCTNAMITFTNYSLKAHLKKIDHLALPFNIGAMENFGLIIYSKGMLLNRVEANMSPDERLTSWMLATSAICHETSHQWFGDVVTNKWWGDIWLHEGFADYFENIATALAWPKEKEYMDYMFAMTNIRELLQHPELDTHPIVTENGFFDTITYGKGGAIIRQLAGVLGADLFQKGLHNYIRKFHSGNANTADFIGVLHDTVKESGVIVKDWCDQPINLFEYLNLWLNQDKFPSITIDYEDSGWFIIKQTAPEGHLLWPLPIFTQGIDGVRTTYWSAPGYACRDGSQVYDLQIHASAMFFNPSELAVVNITYSDKALTAIIEGLTSFSNNLQLSEASIVSFIGHIGAIAKDQNLFTDRLESIYENLLLHQKNAFNFEALRVINAKLVEIYQHRKFDGIIDKMPPSS